MNPFIRSYSYLSRRRWLAWTLWLVVVAVSVLSSSRIRLKEDIGDFLSSDSMSTRYMEVFQQVGGQNRIVVVTSADDVPGEDRTDSIKAAMADFETILQAIDTAGTSVLGGFPAESSYSLITLHTSSCSALPCAPLFTP